MNPFGTISGYFRRARAKWDGTRKKPVKARIRRTKVLRPIFKAEPKVERSDLRHDKYLHAHARRARRAAWSADEPYPFDKAGYWA